MSNGKIDGPQIPLHEVNNNSQSLLYIHPDILKELEARNGYEVTANLKTISKIMHQLGFSSISIVPADKSEFIVNEANLGNELTAQHTRAREAESNFQIYPDNQKNFLSVMQCDVIIRINIDDLRNAFKPENLSEQSDYLNQILSAFKPQITKKLLLATFEHNKKIFNPGNDIIQIADIFYSNFMTFVLFNRLILNPVSYDQPEKIFFPALIYTLLRLKEIEYCKIYNIEYYRFDLIPYIFPIINILSGIYNLSTKEIFELRKQLEAIQEQDLNDPEG